jgi:hypothetical protein
LTKQLAILENVGGLVKDLISCTVKDVVANLHTGLRDDYKSFFNAGLYADVDIILP